MTNRSFMALSALALGLSVAVSTAYAQPSGKGGNYGPQPSAPGDRGDHARMNHCDCMMMQGDAAMRDQCMAMPSRPQDEPAKPGAPN